MATPFETLLNHTIDKHFDHFRETNDKMRLDFIKKRDISLSKLDDTKMWILVGLIVFVILFAAVQALRKKPGYFSRCRKERNEKDASEITTKL